MSKKRMWWGMGVLVVVGLFLAFDSIIHIIDPVMVSQGFVQFGYSASLAVPLGITELICLILYLIPQTSVLGAIFLTGYLGGAVATNLRVGEPFFTFVLAPVYVALFMWLALFLLNEKLSRLVPVMKK